MGGNNRRIEKISRGTSICSSQILKKVKLSRYRPGQALGLPGG
jgi:hypothetical protein